VFWKGKSLDRARNAPRGGQRIYARTRRGVSAILRRKAKLFTSPISWPTSLQAVSESTCEPRVRKNGSKTGHGGETFSVLNSAIDANGRTFLVQLGTPTGEIYETLHTFRRYLLFLAPWYCSSQQWWQLAEPSGLTPVDT